MSENKNLVYILGGVIAVLLAVAGYIVYRNFTSVPDVGSVSGDTATTESPSTGAATTGNTTGNTSVEPAAFDPATATKVTAADPTAHLKAYHEAIVNKEFDKAYKLLPLSMQQKYGDAKSFTDQVSAYGITTYSLGEAETEGDTMKIPATQTTPQMPITYTWTFTKSGGTWYCTDRVMGG